MTDGTTAIPVSPVTEEEAMSISGMFRKAADAVVNASAMPKQIADLQYQVEALSGQVQSSHDHASMLDQQLLDMRDQRNRAEDELALAKAKIIQQEAALADAGNTIGRKEAEYVTLSNAYQQACKDRDDYGLKSMHLEEELGKASQALQDIQARVQGIFNVPAPAVAPQPQPDTGPAYVEQPQGNSPNPTIYS